MYRWLKHEIPPNLKIKFYNFWAEVAGPKQQGINYCTTGKHPLISPLAFLQAPHKASFQEEKV